MNIKPIDILKSGKWLVSVNKNVSTLMQSPWPWVKNDRKIFDLKLYNKADELNTLFTLSSLMSLATELPTSNSFLRDATIDVAEGPFSGGIHSFLMASTSDHYMLGEFQKGKNGVVKEIDRLVENYGKGFEAEVSYKQTFKIISKMVDGVKVYQKEMVGFTIYHQPTHNKNYHKKGAKFSKFKYIQQIDTYTKHSNGTWGQGTHKEIGVNPRNNYKED